MTPSMKVIIAVIAAFAVAGCGQDTQPASSKASAPRNAALSGAAAYDAVATQASGFSVGPMMAARTAGIPRDTLPLRSRAPHRVLE